MWKEIEDAKRAPINGPPERFVLARLLVDVSRGKICGNLLPVLFCIFKTSRTWVNPMYNGYIKENGGGLKDVHS